ncbi:hypothetical protein LZ31DRAFT_558898 [Colletotrichum somersetense]|nr:hypothetical protein LZ31DRAFT_558898 [Colletotrichum somersetense]
MTGALASILPVWLVGGVVCWWLIPNSHESRRSATGRILRQYGGGRRQKVREEREM